MSAYRAFEEYKAEVKVSLDHLQSQISELQRSQRQPSASPVDIQDEIREAMEREKKRFNVVVVGYPESDTAQIRCAGDKGFVEGICDKINVAKEAVEDVFRDGRVKQAEEGRHFARIIKVKFSSWSDKVKFMSNFNRAKPAGSRFYARPDLTYRQRMADNAMREKVKALKGANPGLDIMIYRGDIVYRATKLPYKEPAAEQAVAN
jgi:hypothetical protein